LIPLHRDTLHILEAWWPDWAKFAQWVIVYFGQFLENNRSCPHLMASLFHG
jgi:hypothetical protein